MRQWLTRWNCYRLGREDRELSFLWKRQDGQDSLVFFQGVKLGSV